MHWRIYHNFALEDLPQFLTSLHNSFYIQLFNLLCSKNPQLNFSKYTKAILKKNEVGHFEINAAETS